MNNGWHIDFFRNSSRQYASSANLDVLVRNISSGDEASVMNMYVGCYNDANIRESHLRDIDEFINQGNHWKDVTVPRCLEACRRLGF